MPGHLLDPESGFATGEAGAGEQEDQRHLAAGELVEILRRGDLEVVGTGIGNSIIVVSLKPWTMVEHCIHRNGFSVWDQRGRGPNWSASPAVSAASYARRCGSICTWHRSAMACTRSPAPSVIWILAVSCGTAAYGSATTSSIRKDRSIIRPAPVAAAGCAPTPGRRIRRSRPGRPGRRRIRAIPGGAGRRTRSRRRSGPGSTAA